MGEIGTSNFNHCCEGSKLTIADKRSTDSATVDPKCGHFSIRGYVAEIRKLDRKVSWPFCVPQNHEESEDCLHSLPPMRVPQFKWWGCGNCLLKVNSVTTVTEGGQIRNSGTDNGKTISAMVEPAIPSPHLVYGLAHNSKESFLEGRRVKEVANAPVDGSANQPALCKPNFSKEMKQVTVELQSGEGISRDGTSPSETFVNNASLHSSTDICFSNGDFGSINEKSDVLVSVISNNNNKGALCKRIGEFSVKKYRNMVGLDINKPDSHLPPFGNSTASQHSLDKNNVSEVVAAEPIRNCPSKHSVQESRSNEAEHEIVLGRGILAEVSMISTFSGDKDCLNLRKINPVKQKDEDSANTTKDSGETPLKVCWKTPLLQHEGSVEGIMICGRTEKVACNDSFEEIKETLDTQEMSSNKGNDPAFASNSYPMNEMLSVGADSTEENIFKKGKYSGDSLNHGDDSAGQTFIDEENCDSPCRIDEHYANGSLCKRKAPKMRLISEIMKCDAISAGAKGLDAATLESEVELNLMDGSDLDPKVTSTDNKKSNGTKKRIRTRLLEIYSSSSLQFVEEPQNMAGKKSSSMKGEKKSKKRKHAQTISDDIPMDIVELMARNQHERGLLNSEGGGERQNQAKPNSGERKGPSIADLTEALKNDFTGLLQEENSSKLKKKSINGKSGNHSSTKKAKKGHKDPGACTLYSENNSSHCFLNINPSLHFSPSTCTTSIMCCGDEPSKEIQFPFTEYTVESQWTQYSQTSYGTPIFSNSVTTGVQTGQNDGAEPLSNTKNGTSTSEKPKMKLKKISRQNSGVKSIKQSNHSCLHKCKEMDALRTQKREKYIDDPKKLSPRDLYLNDSIPAMHLLRLMDQGMCSNMQEDRAAMDGNQGSFCNLLQLSEKGHRRVEPVLGPDGSLSKYNICPMDFHCLNQNLPLVPVIRENGSPSGGNSRSNNPFNWRGTDGYRDGISFGNLEERSKPTIPTSLYLESQRKEQARNTAMNCLALLSMKNPSHKVKSCLKNGFSEKNQKSLPVNYGGKKIQTSSAMGTPVNYEPKTPAASIHTLFEVNNKAKERTIDAAKSTCKTIICSVNRNPAEINSKEAEKYMGYIEDFRFSNLSLPNGRLKSTLSPEGRKRKRTVKLAAI
ncbi:hypothetical protein AMTRI_Chr05g66630 [Amborella trichopoda]